MSGTGEVRADFAGEERAFRIRLGEIRRIEDACGKAGIYAVQARLARGVLAFAEFSGLQALAYAGDLRADDVREVLYQGLIGGGMPSHEATRLIRREIDDRGLKGVEDNITTALFVLRGSQEAPDTGEPQAGGSPATPPSDTTSPPSTAPEPPSA